MQNIFSRKTKYLYIAWNEGTCLIFIWKLITDFYLPLRLLAYTRFLFTTILRTLGTHYMNRKIKGHPQRPLYAAPAWWGSTTAEDRSKHQRLHHKMQPDVFDVAALVEDMDGRLLRVVMLHDACVLYSLYPLPPRSINRTDCTLDLIASNYREKTMETSFLEYCTDTLLGLLQFNLTGPSILAFTTFILCLSHIFFVCNWLQFVGKGSIKRISITC